MQAIVLLFALLAPCSAVTHQESPLHIDGGADEAVLLAAYNRLIKSASQLELARGDASAFLAAHKGKEAARWLNADPKAISDAAVQLTARAHAIIGDEVPASVTGGEGPVAALHVAYREILVAAESVELVRRRAATLAPGKLASFVTDLQKDPETVEEDTDKLVKDLEEEVEAAEAKVETAVKTEEKTDDKDDMSEAAAANKAGKQGIAEADQELGEAKELIGEVKGNETAVEEGKKEQEEAKGRVETATEEHKEADAEHEKHDETDDKAEDETEAAKEEHAEAKAKLETAKHGEDGKSSALKAAPLSVVMALLVFGQ